jgi:hypothetical protein
MTRLAIILVLYGIFVGYRVADFRARGDFTRAHADLIARDKAWAEAYQRVEDIATHWGMELRAMNGNCAYDPMNHYQPAAREISFRQVKP